MQFDSPIAPTPISSLPALPSGAALKLQAPGMQAGIGGKLWPASSALCRWMRDEAQISGAHVLELGCGTGACGLYAAALGASSVMLTDRSEDELVLQIATDNVRRNRGLVGERCLVRAHDWGEVDAQYLNLLTLPPRLDFVLGSDLTNWGFLPDRSGATVLLSRPVALSVSLTWQASPVQCKGW